MTTPITANELLENTAKVLMAEDGLDAAEAHTRAAKAVARLMSLRLLEWWGMTDQGEPLFVPSGYITVIQRKEKT